MPSDRFMIAPYDMGLKNDVKPFMIPEQAFDELNNAYAWRSRIIKRPGANPMNTDVDVTEQQYHTRLRMQSTPILVGTTSGAGALAGIIPGAGARSFLGLFFDIAGTTYTVTDPTAGVHNLTRSAPVGIIYTFNVATGAYNFTGMAATTPVYFYQSGVTQTNALGNAAGFFPAATYAKGQMIALNSAGNATVPFIVASNDLLYRDMTWARPAGVPVDITDAAGASAGNAPAGNWAVGQGFSIAGIIFTVTSALAGPQAMARFPAGGGVHTFDLGTGAFVFTGEAINTVVNYYASNATFNAQTGFYAIAGSQPNATVFFYPSLPVMGLPTYQTAVINENPTYAFDTEYCYEYDNGAWERLGAAQWTGLDTNFFWATTWKSALVYEPVLYVTNYNAPDNIKCWNGVIWQNLRPTIAAGVTLDSCKMLFTFHDRLVALNTVENGQFYVNRARWCFLGDPMDANAWNSTLSPMAWATDIMTKEPIVTATLLHDRLTAYCANSAWELVYTDNDVLPFKWININAELGAQSTYSVVNLDRNIIGIGATGVHSCDGIHVKRIDQDIPDEVTKMLSTAEGSSRTYAIRDFQQEMAYWAVVMETTMGLDTQVYPNKILAYNYINNSWSFFDDTITAFGYFEQRLSRTWANMQKEWRSCDFTWNAGTTQQYPKFIVAGNQQGWTFIVNPYFSRNSMALQITAIDVAARQITSINHNLPYNSFVFFEVGAYSVILNVQTIDKDTLQITDGAIPGTPYTGGGTLTRVSRISIKTKPFNFYLKQSRNATIHQVDFLVDSNSGGELFVECKPSYSQLDLVDSASANGSLLGTSILSLEPYIDIPLEAYQDYFWHPIYFNAEGNSVQFWLYSTNTQMLDQDKAFAGFQLHAMMIYTRATTFTSR